MDVDVLIFGGGVAGLWLLDELTCHRHAAVLLESTRLGSGQIIASQGILHGGLKYTLQGLFTESAKHVSRMPEVWRGCLAGRRLPDLSRTEIRSRFCYLWRTASLSSQLGLIGAKIGLHVRPLAIPPHERPAVLARVPGTVARLEEQVISPQSLLANLSEPHSGRILHYDPASLRSSKSSGEVRQLEVSDSAGRKIVFTPRRIVLAAGAGNAILRDQLGLEPGRMQRRPLHMVLVRSDLPQLFGHCVDGSRTRVTVTSARDAAGRTVWQVGGQVSEDGVQMTPAELARHARAELEAVLPGLDLSAAEWSTYRVDRAEGAIPGGRRPDGVQVVTEQNVLTAWPTKLVLAPHLSETIVRQLPAPSVRTLDETPFHDWPRPTVAVPPWDDPGRSWSVGPM